MISGINVKMEIPLRKATDLFGSPKIMGGKYAYCDFLVSYFEHYGWIINININNENIINIQLLKCNELQNCLFEQAIKSETIILLTKLINYITENSRFYFIGHDPLDITKISFENGEIKIYEMCEVTWKKMN